MTGGVAAHELNVGQHFDEVRSSGHLTLLKAAHMCHRAPARLNLSGPHWYETIGPVRAIHAAYDLMRNSPHYDTEPGPPNGPAELFKSGLQTQLSYVIRRSPKARHTLVGDLEFDQIGVPSGSFWLSLRLSCGMHAESGSVRGNVQQDAVWIG